MDVDVVGKLSGSKSLSAVVFPPDKQTNGTTIIIKKNYTKEQKKANNKAKNTTCRLMRKWDKRKILVDVDAAGKLPGSKSSPFMFLKWQSPNGKRDKSEQKHGRLLNF